MCGLMPLLKLHWYAENIWSKNKRLLDNFDTFGRMLKGLWLSTWDLKPLKMGVTWAHFRQEAKFPDWIASFNAESMKSVKSSAFSFMTSFETSTFGEVLDMSKDLTFFQNIVSFYSFKIERFVFMKEMFYHYDTSIAFVFFQYKSYWIISNNWIDPSRKITILIRRTFEARNNISEKCIESFCIFSSLVMISFFSTNIIFGELTVSS